MGLDLERLENLRQRGPKLIARCPACAEFGEDRTGDHLYIGPDGRFGCVVHPGDAGREHRRRIHGLVGTDQAAPPMRWIGKAIRSVQKRACLPELRPLREPEIAQLIQVRQWPSPCGIKILSERGLIFYGSVFDAGRTYPAWIVTDATRRNAEARRLDGQPWIGIGNKKAKTWSGVDRSWPIGIKEAGDAHIIIICEGPPDMIAAALVAWWEGIRGAAPVCMTGAGNALHPDALGYFANREVWIAGHDDAAGREAAHRWSGQLHDAGVRQIRQLKLSGRCKRDGKPVKDLADYATLLDPAVPSDLMVGLVAPI